MIDHKAILIKLRNFMESNNLDFFIVTATDEYLNEYINLEQNARYLLTGFSGSTGDALVTHKDVFLFVDGRYHLQADNETDKSLITVIKLGMNSSPRQSLIEKISELAENQSKVGLISSKISYSGFKKLSETLSDKKIIFQEYDYDPILKFTDTEKYKDIDILKYIYTNYSGSTPEEKLSLANKKFKEITIDFFIITKLEELAYLSNLRGAEIAYSSTFKGKGLVSDNKCVIFTDLDKISDDIKEKFSNKFEFRQEDGFEEYLNEIQDSANVGFNPDSTNLLIYRLLNNTNHNLIEIETSPIAQMKAVKNSAELDHFNYCFTKTDIVVNRAVTWLNQNLEKGEKISEKAFSDKVKSLFLEEGAIGLSFEVIASFGKNTAIIHYTNPDPDKFAKADDLVLLDCGGYFEGGYATDITRTFLAGGSKENPSEKAKEIFTKVLRGFLHGLNYPINENTTGYDIDKKVRDIINKDTDESFKFSHGTGHGVGISVHECPPRISPAEQAKTKLEPGMCFTIEPGLYNDNWGGVRLENTVTIIEEDGKLKIKSFARAKFDENLIDFSKLDQQELEWLNEYQKKALK